MDLSAVRSRFPALEREHDGRPLVYLDGPGGTQVPESVIHAIASSLREGISNLGGRYASSQLSAAIVSDARAAMADLYNASPNEIVFAQNMTSHTFAVSRAMAATWRPGDEIVLTRLDHDANIAPWLRAAEERDVTVRWVDFEDSRLAPASFDAVLSDRTRLVAVTAASNAIGSIVDIRSVAERVHATPAILYVDAVHYAPHRLIDVLAWDADFLVASAYKFFGPHIGILFGKAGLLESLPAYKVRPAPERGPDRWETGTQSFETLSGVTAAVDYLASLGSGESRRDRLTSAYAKVGAHEGRLAERFLAGISELSHVRLFGATGGDRTATFAVAVDGRTDAEVARILGDRGICVSHGTYYAVEVMRSLGQTGLVRVGFVHYNTTDEVDAVLNELDALG